MAKAKTAASPRPYHVLLMLQDHAGGSHWGIEFGDYDEATVVAERGDYQDRGYRRSQLRIITAPSDDQATIDQMVAELNAAR